MFVRALIFAVSASFLTLLAAAPASAGLHVCNRTSTPILIAVAEEWGCDIFGCDHNWSSGWWTIAPSSCKTPIGGSLQTDGDHSYYYYAEDTNGKTWTGDVPFCVDPARSFEVDEFTCKDGRRNYKFRPIKAYSADYAFDLTE